ncbi:hypothetical protein Tco_0715003 [Tanacetum coccineum]
MHMTTPRAYGTPTLTAASPQGKKRKQSEKDDESYASKFAASMLHDDVDDSGNRLEPRSHKDNLEVIDDDDVNVDEKKDEKKDDVKEKDNDDQTDHALVRNQEMDSLENRTEKMQTPIPTPIRSPRIKLSLDKNIVQELTNTISPSTTTTSKGIDKYAFPASIVIFQKVYGKVDQVLYEIVPQISEKATKDLIEGNLKRIVADTVIQERDMKSNLQDQANDPALWDHHDDHQGDDAPPKGEKRVKRHKTSKSSKEVEIVIDEDEVIPKDETPKLLIDIQNVDKRIPAIFDRARMEAILNDMNLNEPPRYLYNKDMFFLKNGNTDEKKYILSPHKIHAEPFPEANLEEKINRWVRKEFKNFNEDARLSIQHWKDSWNKRFCDATLEKVLKEVKLKIFQSEPWKKPPLLGELDHDIMKAYEREISKRLSIPCSTECKTVGQILLDHPISYAFTATADVPVVYLQQFWKPVSKVPETKDTIRFKLDTQEIVYTVDMFHDTLKLPVETPDNPFIAPVNIKVIESFMQTVGYQGVVDKVSAFYTKFLAQLWQTMFKVFNRCLTTRTSRHDQTKINILQLFHVVVNWTNVDYAALPWWDFLNYVFQKKDVIQYPRFTKLIIADLMKKFPSIPQRLDEDYHSIKDDIPLIRATDDYKEYETVFFGVEVPMNQPQPVVSTQGTHRTTPRAYKTPTLTAASPQGKKRKQSVGETSSPRKSLKVTIRQKKQSTTPIPPHGDDRERDEMAEATLLSLTLYKTALAAEAQENIAKVQEKLEEEEIEKMVAGEEDEESYASEFADSIFNDDDDSGTRIEPESHNENPEVVVDDDDVTKKKDDNMDEDKEKDDDVEKTDDAAEEKDNDDHTDHTLVKTHATGSMATRNEQM